MDDMYSMADIAFVGGTFVPVGGHNVWDAARYGIPVLFGPDYHTQQAGCERLIRGGVGFEVADAAEFAHTVVRVLRTEARAFIQAQQAFADELGREGTAIHDLVP
jgi:3-deoxy-D-manno-octulosonic-acid transferase